MNGFEYWLTFDEETRKELEAITDEKEIEDRFYKELEFGTGGLRGIMGAGPNRMNKYTVAKATKGLADYLNASFDGEKSVAIAYDSRNNSAFFADTAASVLAANGIKVYLFNTLMPTPVLSFAVRYHNCTAGIVLTASHNPKEYNGYKVYDSKGCQLVPEYADKVIAFVNAVTDLKNIDMMPLDEAKASGKLVYIGDETLNAFLAEVATQSVYNENSDLKIVYTPLHGTGNIPVRRILEGKNVSVVKSQELPDGNFSTVRSPNPEEKDALTLAIEQAKSENADIVIGTDPDCDRVGVGVLHNGDYVLLTGNQTGALLVDFVLKFRKDSMPENAAVVKTIVTSGLGAAIAEKNGAKIFQTLTGFKYIGEKICLWEERGENTFIFGYEESYGYLAGTHARDKDAVSASMLISEMAAYYKNNGKTLIDAMNGIYEEYGYYFDCLETFVLKGKEGAEKIQSAMKAMRESGESLFDDLEVLLDYSKGIDDLPKENVLRFDFKDGSWAAARPSGTEPKLKLYFSIKGENKEQAQARQLEIRNILAEKIYG
ncbi:MAG: phospho-sugar mutase [Clostridia bacterium]|nr:phospho-sugar mutase [Clostridia bacterium]